MPRSKEEEIAEDLRSKPDVQDHSQHPLWSLF
jgi:hypothetical protein